jgi:hypothetical protein
MNTLRLDDIPRKKDLITLTDILGVKFGEHDLRNDEKKSILKKPPPPPPPPPLLKNGFLGVILSLFSFVFLLIK